MLAARSFFISSSFIVSEVDYNTTFCRILFYMNWSQRQIFTGVFQISHGDGECTFFSFLGDLKGGSSRLHPGPCAYFGPGARVGGLRTAGQGSWVQKPKTPNVYYYPVCSGLAFGGRISAANPWPRCFFLRCTSSSLLPPPICSLKNVGKRIKEYEWMISEVIWP